MFSRSLLTSAACIALLLSGCSPSFDAENEANKNEILGTRDEMTLRLAQASESGNDLANAERQYIQLSKSGSTKAIMELAGFYTRHNQAGRAVEILDAAYKKSPKDMNLMRSLANALISAGNPEKALVMLDGAVASHNDMAYIYNSRGVALDKLGRYDEAQSSYKKALAINPADEADFKTNLSMSYILDGHYNDAIKLLNPMLAAKTATPAVRQNLALAYGLKGNMDMAMKVGSKDLTIKEMNENIRFYTLMTKGKYSGSKTAAAANEPADVFPGLATPPIPTAAEEAPPVTTVTDAPPAPPEPIHTATSAPSVPVSQSPAPVTITPEPAAKLTPEVVRNLTKEPPAVIQPALPAPVIVAAPEPATPVARFIKPAAKEKTEEASLPTPIRKKTTIAPSEAIDDAPVKPDAVVDAGNGTIPLPVLKPDKW